MRLGLQLFICLIICFVVVGCAPHSVEDPDPPSSGGSPKIPPRPVLDRISDYLEDRKFQIKKEGEAFHIAGILEGGTPVSIKHTGTFSGSIDKLKLEVNGDSRYISVDGIGKASFKFDEEGEFRLIPYDVNKPRQ